MGHTLASWKTLEDLLITVKKEGVEVPASVVDDLRAAKSMIMLACVEDRSGDAVQKAEELTANVEAFLITEAQKVFSPETVNDWLKRLEEANCQVCEEAAFNEKFIIGVPRDQKWIRMEPTEAFSADQLENLASQAHLSAKRQIDGKLVICGNSEDLRAFIKLITVKKSEATS